MAVTTLRFTTAGSVDDGKSTLIGRLLLDARGLLEDQLASVARTTQRRGGEGLDLSLFTDGLTLEREQGITIDVAYRYFATPRRRFIIADTPGHEQYTRNMVTGASTADLSVILVDARRGISAQTRRHAAIAALLEIPKVVVAVNKMDAVDFGRSAFEEVSAEFRGMARSLGLANVDTIPISALAGDMVVSRGEHLPWYEGPTLLEVLESAPSERPSAALRLPVQLVSRSRFGRGGRQRGYLGRIESGTLSQGDTIVAWPHGVEACVTEILTHDGELLSTSAGRSVTVVLDRQVDIARGDVLSHVEDPPTVVRRFGTRLAWLDRDPFAKGRRYWLKHGAQTVRATVESVESRLDLATLQPGAAQGVLDFNDLGSARIAAARPLVVDAYGANRAGGSFILIDEASHHTVAAGMISDFDCSGAGRM
ncbi:MAG TPA: GTP-binding protein [Croceibacterium sp.]|nr:GTP-binding protein [Croceibacterium sp.]